MRILLVAVLLVPLAAAACSAGPSPGSAEAIQRCREIEAPDYPPMERLVADVLGSAAARVERGMSCEDTGEPDAYVDVYVPGWSGRREGNRYFARALGWPSDGNGGFVTPDGAYRIWVSRLTEADGVTSYAVVQVRLVSGS